MRGRGKMSWGMGGASDRGWGLRRALVYIGHKVRAIYYCKLIITFEN